MKAAMMRVKREMTSSDKDNRHRVRSLRHHTIQHVRQFYDVLFRQYTAVLYPTFHLHARNSPYTNQMYTATDSQGIKLT